MYSISRHAAEQAEQKGFTLAQVYAAANSPTISYDSMNHPGQKRHIRGDLVAVVDPRAQRVITIYKNVERTPLRKDQKK